MNRHAPVPVLLLALAASACAAGANPEVGTVTADAVEPAGFWLGLWHGFISPVTFSIPLFR